MFITCVCLTAFGQIAINKKAITADQLPPMQRIDKAQVAALKSHSAAQSNGRAQQQIILDYDAVDGLVTTDAGGVYDYFIWNLNSKYNVQDTNIFALHWGVVVYDTLYDAENLVAFPFSSTSVKIDSIQTYITHQNITGNADTVLISVYRYEGTVGLRINNNNQNQAGQQIINQVLYDTMIISTTSLTGAPNIAEPLSIYPNLQLAQGEKFLVGVHFYGDTANTFTILAGYGERCGGACAMGQGAWTSAFELNSWWRIIAWVGTNNLTGVNGIAYNCDGDGIIGEKEECEEFSIQNFAITTFVTIDPALTSTVSAGASVCPGTSVTMSVNPVGGTPPYNVAWTPTTGLSAPFSPTTNVTATTTTTYTATIIDNDNDTITKTVTVTVNAITVNAGIDQNINCGETADLLANASGQVSGATFLWSNLVNTLNNPGVGAGTYTITASNSFGCSTSDAVQVVIPGVDQVLSFTTGLPNNIGCNGETIQLTNTSKRITGWAWLWDFDDNGNISTGQSPQYIFNTNGTYTVSLSADSAGCTVQSVTKTVTIQTCIPGFEESELSKHVEMYPNPTTGLFTISFSDVGSRTGVVGIYDIRGALIVEEPVSVAGNTQKTVNLSAVADGVYFVKVQLGDDVMMRKLTLSR